MKWRQYYPNKLYQTNLVWEGKTKDVPLIQISLCQIPNQSQFTHISTKLLYQLYTTSVHLQDFHYITFLHNIIRILSPILPGKFSLFASVFFMLYICFHSY
jgi:hypothetical protein